MMVTKVLAEGKRLRLAMASQEGVTVRWGLKEAGVQNCEPTCLRADAQAGGQKWYLRLDTLG